MIEMLQRTGDISTQRTFPARPELTPTHREVIQSWHRGFRLLSHTRAYADLFAHLQRDSLLQTFRDGGQVLDCSIGTVAFSLTLTNVRVQMDGINITPHMYHQAYNTPARAGVNVRVYHGEVDCLPFASETFDMVVSAPRLEQAEGLRDGIVEMTRVLRPGAPLVIILNDHSAANPANTLSWHYPTVTAAQLIHWMHTLGLKDVHQYNLSSDHAPLPGTDVACIGIKPLSQPNPQP